ncbi:MAG: xanthine dehydrogenase family protein molybdopterin-binding subunit [Alphaproteobacteria bacterium]|nr:xanthine dehydrogenase family protein molybdopterin-binding subunit [Alphaproteobacteria bacterium]
MNDTDTDAASRPDLLEKVTGRAVYASDISVPGMAQGRILRSTVPHARIVRLDCAAAAALEGVITVLTGADLASLAQDHWGLFLKDRPVIAVDKVRYVGEPVALVVAETAAIAEAALDLIDVDYEDLPFVDNAVSAIAQGAPLLHESHETIADFYFKGEAKPVAGSNVFQKFQVSTGDVDAAEAAAAGVFEHSYSFPGVSHFALEPHCVVAAFEEADLTVWSGAQSPTAVQKVLSRVFGLALANIRVIVPHVGGGFGGKASVKVEPLVAAAAYKARRPVRVALSLEESMLTCRRLGAEITLRTAVDENGKVLAKRAAILLDGGAYADTGPAVAVKAAHRVIGPYGIENLEIEAKAVYTNTVPGAAFRSIGGPQAVWATESQMDEIAESLTIDPVELRRRNLLPRGGKILDTLRPLDVDMGEMLSQADRAMTALGSGPAAGLAMAATDPGIMPIGGALVRVLADGSIVVMSNSVEIGQGVRAVLREVAAKTLNQDPAAIRVANPDTAAAPFDWGTGASRSTVIMGLAVEDAARDASDQILALAASVFDGAPNDIRLVPRGVAHGDDVLSFQNLYHKAFGVDSGEVVGRAMVTPVRGGSDFTKSPLFWETAVGACDVEVDEETGEVAVSRYVGVADIGRAINRTGAEGQEEGASVQGMGHAMFEHLDYVDGQPVNATPVAYRVPAAGDIPAHAHTVLIENGDGPGPMGAKGMGEGGILPVAPAIANALARRHGIRIRDLPLTPERIWRALRNRGDDAP